MQPPVRLAPIATAPDDAWRFARRAGERRSGDGIEPSTWLPAVLGRIASGERPGRLYVRDGRPAGFVSWTAGSPLGISVDLLYVEPRGELLEEYGRLLATVALELGAIAFVHGPVPDLPPADEQRLFEGLGFRPCSRSEMVRDAGASGPTIPSPPGERLRAVADGDRAALVALHRRAYHGTFDRFLFLEVEDEEEDARRAVEQILGGQFGPFLPEGSPVAERGGRLVGAVLAVRTPAGALIADVATDPELQHQGIGRRVLSEALRGLAEIGVARVYLNVTEGNEPALHLYRSLGFRRSLGPSRDWYHAGRIPVAPIRGP